jgi:hypothetical protein
VNENAQVELRTPIPTAGMMVTGAGAMQPPNPHVKVLIEEHQMGGGFVTIWGGKGALPHRYTRNDLRIGCIMANECQ